MRRPACGGPRVTRADVEPEPTGACASMAMAALVSSFVVLASACVPRHRMCTASSDCADKNACVAGRCQIEKGTLKPAVDSARRLVVRPVDIGYVRRGDGPSGGTLPMLVALGRDGGKLFLRFSVVLPPAASVVEAYVILRRAAVVDDDPIPVSLHATRIVEPWGGGSVSWAMQPRVAETRLPSTVVEPGGTPLVRLDVRDLVRHWPRHDPADQGIAIVADHETRTGTTFALSAAGSVEPSWLGEPAGRGGFSSVGPDVEPYLELYVR